jgi:ribosomal protein L13
VKPLTVQKKWYLIDAEGKELGKVAVAAARIFAEEQAHLCASPRHGDYCDYHQC